MKSKANQAAIEAIRRQIQPIAFDANLYDRGIGDYPHAERCSQKRKELLAEIEALSGESAYQPKGALCARLPKRATEAGSGKTTYQMPLMGKDNQ